MVSVAEDFQGGTSGADLETSADWVKHSFGSGQVGNLRFLDEGGGVFTLDGDEFEYAFDASQDTLLSYRRVESFGAAQRAGLELTDNSFTGVGPMVRLGNPGENEGDGYLLLYGSGVARILRFSSGLWVATIAESFPTTTVGEFFEIEAIDDQIKAYVDGVEILSATDANYATGDLGIGYWKGLDGGTGGTSDNFAAFDIATDVRLEQLGVETLSEAPPAASVRTHMLGVEVMQAVAASSARVHMLGVEVMSSEPSGSGGGGSASAGNGLRIGMPGVGI